MNLIFKNYIHLTQEQSQTILELRNSDYIRSNMHNSEIIPLNNHLNWVETLKTNFQKEYFALILDDVVVGSCSFVQDENGVSSWGIFFVKTINPLISSVSAYLFMQYLFDIKGFTSIDSQVLKTNSLALRFNQNLGFCIYKEEKEFFRLSLSKKQWQTNTNNRFITSIKRYLGRIKYEFQ